ncbi:MAG: phosphatase PAP2 family protein [Clostridia bacterium]|nr:phosphatase PAP2 family protein [Clostridia bacterium]
MDIAILQWIHVNLHGIVWLNYAFKYITLLGEKALFSIILCVLLIIIKKTRKCGLACAIGLALNILIVNVILKNIVGRERPWTEYAELESYFDQYNILLPDDSSFPSGHTAAIFCTATILTLFYKAKVGVPAYIIAVLVALSRIWLCVHYPTDVLAGAVIGSACAAAGYFIFKFIDRKLANRKKSKGKQDS